MWSPDFYLAAWNYAAQMHGEQKVPGTQLPYLAHVGAVAMEVMTALAQGRRAVGSRITFLQETHTGVIQSSVPTPQSNSK